MKMLVRSKPTDFFIPISRRGDNPLTSLEVNLHQQPAAFSFTQLEKKL